MTWKSCSEAASPHLTCEDVSSPILYKCGAVLRRGSPELLLSVSCPTSWATTSLVRAGGTRGLAGPWTPPPPALLDANPYRRGVHRSRRGAPGPGGSTVRVVISFLGPAMAWVPGPRVSRSGHRLPRGRRRTQYAEAAVTQGKPTGSGGTGPTDPAHCTRMVLSPKSPSGSSADQSGKMTFRAAVCLTASTVASWSSTGVAGSGN